MIPTKTGAAEAVGQVLPELAGKLTGLAVRVPVINVSLVDLTVQVARDTSVDEVNRLLREASEGSPVLGYNTQPLVSVDFNHDPRSSIFDANHTKVSGRLVKAMAWYDNEWGFSNRMLDSALALAAATDAPQRNLRRPRACNASRRRSASARISRCSALSARFQARISWRVRPQPRHTSASNSQILMQGLFKRSPFSARTATGPRPSLHDRRWAGVQEGMTIGPIERPAVTRPRRRAGFRRQARHRCRPRRRAP